MITHCSSKGGGWAGWGDEDVEAVIDFVSSCCRSICLLLNFRYGLISLKSPPAAKSLVQPDFINTFYIHIASAYKPYTPFLPASTCMLLVSDVGWAEPWRQLWSLMSFTLFTSSTCMLLVSGGWEQPDVTYPSVTQVLLES